MGRLNTFLCCHGRLWHAKSSVVDPYLFTSLDPDYFFSSIHKVEYIVSEPFLTLMYSKLAYSQGKETLLHPPPLKKQNLIRRREKKG